MEFEKYNAKIWKINNSLVVTIPENVAKYAGYEAGDELKIISKKITEKQGVQKC